MLVCLCNKMPPKKVKIKERTKLGLNQIWTVKNNLNYNFFYEHFVTKAYWVL